VPIEIELLPPAAAEDALLEELRDRINRVYEVAESGLWLEGHVRMGAAEMAESVRGGEIAVARLDRRVVGSVQIRRLDRETGELGLLAADPEHRGVGVGRELVRFAETLSRSRGLSTMQLGFVVPREWTHPVKQFLHEWYSRLGYRIVRKEDFREAEPEAAPLLATECDFLIYRKPL
jgi:GNAT superfamily N-acetyltransferase